MHQPPRRAENCPPYRCMLNAVVERVLKGCSSLRAPGSLSKMAHKTVTIKAQAKAVVLSKLRDLWLARIPVVRPDATEFFLVNGAVFCRLQLALNLPQQFSHPVPPQSLPKVTINSEKRRVPGCILRSETPGQ